MEEKTKICPACAEEIKAEAKKCKHCGELQDASDNEFLSKEERIQENLLRMSKRHSTTKDEVEYREVRCLDCGYYGDMVVVRKLKKEWYERWFVLVGFAVLFEYIIRIFLVTAAYTVLMLIIIFRKRKTDFVGCPSCEKTLGPI